TRQCLVRELAQLAAENRRTAGVRKLAHRIGERSGDGRYGQSSMGIRHVVGLAPSYLTAVTDRKPTRITSVASTGKGGWIIEVEVVEDWGIPSSADILALYEIKLDADGELLASRRTRRYMREPGVVTVAGGRADRRETDGELAQ